MPTNKRAEIGFDLSELTRQMSPAGGGTGEKPAYR
jgi:hypothetical protein